MVSAVRSIRLPSLSCFLSSPTLGLRIARIAGLVTTLLWGTTLAAAYAQAQAPAAKLPLRPGDHISLIGNTFADRMQHTGWLETYLHARFPKHALVIRNLGFSGDELTLRIRSANFGTPEHWLGFNKTDVVFAFFGYNESHGGEAKLADFEKDLADFLTKTLAAKFNDKSAPRVVLFSPIAHENLKSPHLPDGSANNERLRLYTKAMAKVAADLGVPFVDLFEPTLKLYQTAAQPCTINGIHVTPYGDQQISAIIDKALFGGEPAREPKDLEPLRRLIVDKNFHWYQRYRTTDGYSIYGGRADEPKVGEVKNRPVMAREMEILDVLTANRDKAIWALAQGQTPKIDDSNTPEFIPVPTNRPGPNPDGTYPFLSGKQAIDAMTLGANLNIQLFASEEKFKELINPVQMAFDTKGRLWVAAWPTYPHWRPKDPLNDALLILEDTDGDGQADVCKTFATGLHNPTGFEFWNGGVLVAMAPELLFLKDTDGDDKADVRVQLVHGLDTADTHHTANSFTLDPGGALYFQEGTFHHTQVETPWGPPRRVANGAVFRYEPRAQKLDVYVSHNFANPHGHAFDRWGQDIVVDGTGAVPYHAALFSGHIDFPSKHAKPPTVYQQRTRPCPSIEYISSGHFPEEWRGNLLVANVIGFQGILRYKVGDKDSSFGATELEPIVSSKDPNFRPADLEIGPDGALYFTDWQNPIIGHLQHNMREPNRDKTHGRVYKVTYAARPLLKPETIVGAPIDKLLDLLKHPDDRVRYRTRIELSSRATDSVIAAAERWTQSLAATDSEFEHHMLEALWLHQNHDVVNIRLLERLLASKDFRARAAAVRVLCYWRDRVSNALDLLKKAAADEHGRVRLEAVRAASFFPVAEAIEIPLIAAELPGDVYLDYLQSETRKVLDPLVNRALADGRKLEFTSEAGARFFLKTMPTEKLLLEKRTRAVYAELLYRPGLRDELRREAVQGLAGLDQKPELRVVMDALRFLDEKQQSADTSVIFDLIRQLTARRASELSSARAELERLATTAKQAVFRQIGFVSLISVDGSVEPAWKLATTKVSALQDFLSAMPLISDASVRATLYDRVAALLGELPAGLASSAKGTLGRFVRVELPRKGTLTVAEVEVYSNGNNVARKGRATQKNTASGGEASRGIDGILIGDFSSGGQTHTEIDTNNPWWEVDLGDEFPIESIRIYNRTDGKLHERLEGFNLIISDNQHKEVLRREKNPAPRRDVTFDFEGAGAGSQIRKTAMLALTYVRGKEAATFKTLSKFVIDNTDRLAAVRALQRIPRALHTPEEAVAMLPLLVEHVRQTPAAERTGAAILDVLEFADTLTGSLPSPEAKKLRAELSELGVRVIRVGTVLEKMIYDRDLIVVKAGKPVEFLIENNDLMPHNFAIITPGSLAAIGALAEAQTTDPQAAQRHFIPKSPAVLKAGTLLQPRSSERIPFDVPTKPGVYPYVCTYPGHWRRMVGALYVVDDLDAYLANPEGYLAANPLPILDDPLKDRRPRTEWKFEDLAAGLDTLHEGRSFGNAKQLFTVASCVACHKLGGTGNVFGPDLSKLDPKFKPVDVLKELLDPSARINEKFQAFIFETKAGKVVTGLVLEETGDGYKIIENPLAKAEPIVLKKADVLESRKSPTSIMPKGLLEKLTRDEILDLIAYVMAKGEAKHPLFEGGAHPNHGNP